jgi:isoleucyl-tRNA synthetase
VIRVVQQARKDARLDVSDRIVLTVDGDDQVVKALDEHHDLIAGETLATDIQTKPVTSEDHAVGEQSRVRVQVERV